MGFDSSMLPEKMLQIMSASDRAKLGPAGRTWPECVEIADTKSEKHLQTLCEAYARQHNVPFFRQRMDRRSNMKIGTPDAFLCVNGLFVACEFKVGMNSVSPDQAKILLEIQIAKGWACVIRSFKDFVDVLNTLTAEHKPLFAHPNAIPKGDNAALEMNRFSPCGETGAVEDLKGESTNSPPFNA